jgi:hypothetical protein
MNRHTYPHSPFRRVAGLALAALAMLGLARLCPVFAQQPSRNLVPLKLSLTGPLTPRFVIPLEPEIRLGTFTADGTSDLLGAVKFVEANTVHVGADGKLLAVTDGKGVLTGANGDALFISYSGLVLPSQVDADFAFTVTGGRGRFLGATGSGVIHCSIHADQKNFTRAIEGMVSEPVVR